MKTCRFTLCFLSLFVYHRCLSVQACWCYFTRATETTAVWNTCCL